MSCPTCDHTMHSLGTAPRYFWCPRCGTIKSCEADIAAPALVDRCRRLRDLSAERPELAQSRCNIPSASWNQSREETADELRHA